MIISPIGSIRSPYKQKFGIPRQAGLVESVESQLVIDQLPNPEQLVEGLDSFSHIWVVFAFHKLQANDWKPKVRPPRLGGNKRVGVLATRSPFRPNHLGFSAVSLISIEKKSGQVLITVKGGDFLDATPIIDIKPYIPYCDSILSAHSSWTPEPQTLKRVLFSNSSLEQLKKIAPNNFEHIKINLEQVLAHDPRPAYEHHKSSQDFNSSQAKSWFLKFHQLDFEWVVYDQIIMIINIKPEI